MFPAGKGGPEHRLTYLLRPNVQKPDYEVTITLETPPATDADYSSQFETTDSDSDFVKDRDIIDSDVEDHLDPIEKVSSPQHAPIHSNSHDIDAYGDESGSKTGQDLADTVDLSLEDTQVSWNRSTSSPARLLVRPRRLPFKRKKRQVANLIGGQRGNTFYDYLFT